VLLQDQGGPSVLEERPSVLEEEVLASRCRSCANGAALALPCAFDLENLGEGSTWVLGIIIFFL